MKKFLMKIDRWIFGSVAGKIIMVFLAIFGLASLIAAIVKYDHAYEMVKDARWKAEMAADEWRGHHISRNVMFKDYRRVRGKGYVENIYEGEKTVDNVEWIRLADPNISQQDSMAVFSRYVKGRGSRKGYLNIYDGRVRIDDKFKHAWNFKNGRYAVACLDNDSLYVINRNGDIVSKRGFKLSTEWRFGFMVNDDLCIMEENNGKFGIINPTGEWVLEPEYEWIVRNPLNGDYKVMAGNLHGIKDKEMNDILPIKFKDIRFHEYWDDPDKDAKWMKEVAYWAETEDGATEYYDETGKLLNRSVWQK